MTEDPTMNKLEARQGIDINEFIRPPDTEEHQVNLPSRIINTLHNTQFTGSSTEEPHTHLMQFQEICTLVRIPGIKDSHIKMLLFPFSLGGSALELLNSHPHHSLTSWEQIKDKFFKQLFPE